MERRRYAGIGLELRQEIAVDEFAEFCGEKVAIVTGASSGIGRATAIALASAGAAVVVNHLPASRGKAEAVVREIENNGGHAIAIGADISREDQVNELFSETLDRLDRLDILVNNAGIQRGSSIQDMTLADWQAVIDVNLTGQFLCSRAAARVFLKQKAGEPLAVGAIIFIGSVHQVIPWAFQANYAASKGGVSLLMQSLAQELAPMKIRVNSVAPGAIRTPINREAWESDEKMKKLLKLIPYGRIGDPRTWPSGRLAGVGRVGLRPGTTLFMDGGMTLYPAFRGGG